MPSLFIFHRNVVRFIPRQAAAPFGPPSTQPVSRTSLRRCSRSGWSPRGGLLHALADQLDHLAFVGEFTRLQLRVHHLSVERQLEATASRGNELQRANLLLKR